MRDAILHVNPTLDAIQQCSHIGEVELLPRALHPIVVGISGTPYDEAGSIIPYDLSVNHLQRIERSPGSPDTIIDNDNIQDTYNNAMAGEAETSPSAGKVPVSSPEDFLPVVLPTNIAFRWRSQFRPNCQAEDVVRTTAYRIVARRALSVIHDESDGKDDILWDSGKVVVEDGLPDVVHCKYDTKCIQSMTVGSIVEWQVTVWDSNFP